jgi:hypothetical protein
VNWFETATRQVLLRCRCARFEAQQSRYAASAHEVAQTMALPFLAVVGQVFQVAAVLAWAAAFVGLLRQLARRLNMARRN